MKSISTTLRSAYTNLNVRFALAMTAVAGMLTAGANPAYAVSPTDLTQNTAGNKNLTTVTGNIDTAAQNLATLIISIVTIGGFVVVAISLYQMYKASKDEREKPVSAIVGLFIGGAMAAVGTIMWIMRNTIVGA